MDKENAGGTDERGGGKGRGGWVCWIGGGKVVDGWGFDGGRVGGGRGWCRRTGR